MPDSVLETVEPKLQVDIADNNMCAYITLIKPASEQGNVSEDEIYNQLYEAGVNFGVRENEISLIAEGKKEGERFLIAEGVYPVHGKDSLSEFYFSTGSSFKPKVSENGHIDYKDVDLVKSVLKDTVLIKKTSATPGINGYDVTGKELKALPGKNTDISLGAGVYRDSADNNVVKAAVDGIIFYDEKKNTLEVQKLYKVQKSVDYHTGNINVKSSVEVEGDVKPYFKITTPYNIQIRGIIDNASVNCGGSLSVTGGIVGDGKQLICVSGDVHTAYINNQYVKCCSSIYVNSEIRNSIIECEDEIVMVKGSSVIIGGKISAKNKIVAAIVGNIYSVRTEIEVGMRLEYGEVYNKKLSEKKVLKKKVETLKAEIADFTEGRPEETAYIDTLFARMEESDIMLGKIQKEISEIESNYYNCSNPVIQISGRIYPGVIIRMKHAMMEITEEMSHVQFYLDEDETIMFTHLS